MARIAACVESAEGGRCIVVRVMATGAPDAVVGGVVAAAVHQAVGLETDVGNVVGALRRDSGPRPVALAAEIGGLFAAQLAELLRHGLHLRAMDRGAFVAAPALDPRG